VCIKGQQLIQGKLMAHSYWEFFHHGEKLQSSASGYGCSEPVSTSLDSKFFRRFFRIPETMCNLVWVVTSPGVPTNGGRGWEVEEKRSSSQTRFHQNSEHGSISNIKLIKLCAIEMLTLNYYNVLSLGPELSTPLLARDKFQDPPPRECLQLDSTQRCRIFYTYITMV